MRAFEEYVKQRKSRVKGKANEQETSIIAQSIKRRLTTAVETEYLQRIDSSTLDQIKQFEEELYNEYM
jgi:hypothetical protein